MTVVRSAEYRRTETPTGVMTTLASPTQGGASQPIWRVEMGPGAKGPLHVIDAEQTWTFIEGGVTVELGDETHTVKQGDTLIIPADVSRQVVSDTGCTAIVTCPAGAQAGLTDSTERSTPPWMA